VILRNGSDPYMKIFQRSSERNVLLALTCMILFSIIAIGFTYAIPFWVVAIPCAFVLLQGVYSCWWLPLRQAAKREKELREQREKTLRMMSQYRHDWLNHIQLVQGYMQMKKYERIAAPIRTCVEEARIHAKIGRLPSPLVAYRFMEVTLSYPLLQIDVQAPGLIGENLPFVVESELADTLFEICAKGGELANRRGQPVHWSFSILQRGVEGFSIGLHISGESINDDYVDEIISIVTGQGLVFESSDPVADGYQLTFHLSYCKKGLRLPKRIKEKTADRLNGKHMLEDLTISRET
jgi:hypothetical protein